MPRGKYVNHKGRNRHFTSPEELERERKEDLLKQRRRKEEGLDTDDEDTEAVAGASGAAAKAPAESGDSESGSESDSEDDASKKKKGVEGLIQIENPNRVVKKQKKVTRLKEGEGADDKPELSRREREELEKQRARAHYQKLHAEGKTDEARADLARLALVRKQREEAAKKREEELQAKEAAKAAKVEATGKALGKRT